VGVWLALFDRLAICYVSHLLGSVAQFLAGGRPRFESSGGTDMNRLTLKIAPVCAALFALILVSNPMGVVRGRPGVW